MGSLPKSHLNQSQKVRISELLDRFAAQILAGVYAVVLVDLLATLLGRHHVYDGRRAGTRLTRLVEEDVTHALANLKIHTIPPF